MVNPFPQLQPSLFTTLLICFLLNIQHNNSSNQRFQKSATKVRVNSFLNLQRPQRARYSFLLDPYIFELKIVIPGFLWYDGMEYIAV